MLKRRILLSTLLMALAIPQVAAAQRISTTEVSPAGDARAFGVRLIPDLVLTLVMFGAGQMLERQKYLWDGLEPCSGEVHPPQASELSYYRQLGDHRGACDRQEVNAFDRWVTDNYSPPVARASDFLLAGVMLAPLAMAGVDAFTSDLNEPGTRWGQDSLMIFETYAATYLATNLLKIAIHRRRPLTFNNEFDKEARFAGDARLSFPSGHSSMSFAAAATLAVMLEYRHGDSLGTYLGSGLGFAAATTVAALRVIAGKHFLSDVLAGAALGTAIGLLVPRFHRSDLSRDPRNYNLTPQVSPLFSMGGSF